MELTLPRYEFPMVRHPNIRFVFADEGTYGDLLRKERLSRGWSQVALARRITAILYPDGGGEVRQGIISAYERGETQVPHPDYAAAIDEAFGYPRGELMGRVENPALGRVGERRAQRTVLPRDIVIHDPSPGMRRIWEHISELPDRFLLDVERALLQFRGQEQETTETDEAQQGDTESGTKESDA